MKGTGGRSSPLTRPVFGTPEEIRKFGFLFGVICIAAAVYARYAESAYWLWWIGGGAAFLFSGRFAPAVLRPVYRVWMRFAGLLAWINTRLLLGIFFYLVMTPIGLLLRLMGKDLLERRIDAGAASYWKKREEGPTDRERYTRLF
jgi:hypothetical protein